MIRLLIILCILSCNLLHAQNYYFKSFKESQGLISKSLTTITDIGIVYVSQLDGGGLLFRQIDRCGKVVLERIINHPTKPLTIVDIRKDSIGDLIISGNIEYSSGSNTYGPFIMSVNLNGIVNYFRLINTYIFTPALTAYSFMRIKNEGFYLYSNFGGAFNVIKFDNQGNLIWKNDLSGLSSEGRGIVTKDGGVLIRSGSTISKINPDGTISWSKNYTNLGYFDYPIEVSGGFVFFKYPSSTTINTTNLVKIDTQGEILWVSNNFTNFNPERGILRNNGNILFTGAAQGVGLLEADTSTGNIIRFKTINPTNFPQLIGESLFENNEGEIVISGKILSNSSDSTSLFIKIDSSLALQSCPSNNLILPVTTGPNITASLQVISSLVDSSSGGIYLRNETLTNSLISNNLFETICDYNVDKGTFKLGNDTILCPKQSLVIGSSESFFDKYIWSTGDTTKQITISSEGTYILSVIDVCDTLRDTINVGIFPNVDFFIGDDTTACSGNSITLRSNIDLSNYRWSTGETSPTITVRNSGMYWLATDAICGEVRDSINVVFRPTSGGFELGEDTLICPGQQVILGNSTLNFNQFRWNNGDTTQFILVKDSGLYIVEASNFCDTIIDSIKIQFAPSVLADFSIELPEVKTFQLVKLINKSFGIKTASWNLGDGTILKGDTINHLYNIPGLYTIRLTITTFEGCEFYSEKQIIVLPSECVIPNIFTPNKDGVNDQFLPRCKDIDNFELEIFNRWGGLIYKTKNNGWNGRNKNGIHMNNGSYFYILKIYWNYGGHSIFEGIVTLVN